MTDTPNQARDLAQFVVDASFRDLPDATTASLKRSVLDTLGCAIGALDEVPVRGVREAVGELGGAPISTMIGGGRTSPDRAALHNGAAIRYFDFNDTYLGAREGGHPSDNFAPVLAAAEHAGATGTDLLTALAVAYQVQCRLIEAAPVRHRGFDHTTVGIYAVAAGVAKALALDEEQTANAIRIAGTAFNALRVTRTGRLSHWKGLAYASASSSGIQAAYLAKHGITGPELVFEGTKGFMDAIAGAFHVDWGSENFDMPSRVMLKRYNAEGHSQTALEAIEGLVDEHGFSAQEIGRVDVDTFDAAFHIIGGGEEGDKHDVVTKEDADHSMPYIVAVFLLDGQIGPAQYRDERVTADDVQDLLRRVHIHEDESLTDRFPTEMPARVHIELKDGRQLSRELSDYAGFPTRPMSWDQVVDKFEALVEDRGDPPSLGELPSAVADLDGLEDVRELTSMLENV